MLQDIYHFLQLNDRLFSGGMPTAKQLEDVARAGVQVVINLALPDSERALRDEQSIVKSLGMQYSAIPVVWEHPRRRDLEEFMGTMDDHAVETLFVHCQANYRASAFIALYRVLRLGWDVKEALKDLSRIWNPADYPVWKKFIEENLATAPHRPESEAGP